MEALPLFLDTLLNPLGAVLLSVTAILIFGEVRSQLVTRFDAAGCWLARML